ncbi:MAG: hypothetical protein GY737_16890 [Desulfobacteraceae bacterium]|nr:hypothetical protein [Desulfobacteraceae bacterium]
MDMGIIFPFFLMGHYRHSLIVEKIQEYNISKLIGAGVLLGCFTVFLIVPESNDINVGWLYGSRSYAGLGVGWEKGVLYRLSIYAAAFFLGMVLLSIVQDGRNIGTRYGEDSLYIYVLHGFVMIGLIAAGGV